MVINLILPPAVEDIPPPCLYRLKRKEESHRDTGTRVVKGTDILHLLLWVHCPIHLPPRTSRNVKHFVVDLSSSKISREMTPTKMKQERPFMKGRRVYHLLSPLFSVFRVPRSERPCFSETWHPLKQRTHGKNRGGWDQEDLGPESNEGDTKVQLRNNFTVDVQYF